MWSGQNLTDQLRNLLFNSAQDMFNNGGKILTIKTDWCEGIVETSYETKGIGGTYGYAFTATIEWNVGKTEVEYICRKTDLRAENGFWSSSQDTPFGQINPN